MYNLMGIRCHIFSVQSNVNVYEALDTDRSRLLTAGTPFHDPSVRSGFEYEPCSGYGICRRVSAPCFLPESLLRALQRLLSEFPRRERYLITFNEHGKCRVNFVRPEY